MHSTANIWNMSDDESDEEESLTNNYTYYSENICSITQNLWIERGKLINNDYAVTGKMLRVITHISRMSSIIQIEIIGDTSIMSSRRCLMIYLKVSGMKRLIPFGVNITTSIMIFIL